MVESYHLFPFEYTQTDPLLVVLFFSSYSVIFPVSPAEIAGITTGD
jgi:hypothetical protein